MNKIVKFASDQFQGIAGRSNVEGMYSACGEPFCRTVYFIKKIEQSETTLRYSAVHHSAVLRFAVQSSNPEPLNPEPLNGFQ